MTKVTIFSGFLGAGKTTLIKKLIQEGYTGEKIVLLENEYGDGNVDSAILTDMQVELERSFHPSAPTVASRNALYRGLRKETPSNSKLAQTPAFATVGAETTQSYSEQKLTALLGQLSDTAAFGTVLRLDRNQPVLDVTAWEPATPVLRDLTAFL